MRRKYYLITDVVQSKLIFSRDAIPAPDCWPGRAGRFMSWKSNNETASALAALWIVLGLVKSHPFGKSPDYFEILKPRPVPKGWHC